MSEEENVTPAQDTPATPPTEAPASAAPVQPEGATPAEPDIDELLGKIDAARLRKHPRFAGVLGNELQQARQRWEQESTARQQAEARQKAQDELRDMARQRPVEFAEKWLSDEDRKDFLAQLDGTKREALSTFASYVGRAYNDLPEWSELSQDEREKVMGAISGLPDDQVVAVANKAVIEIVAERRAARKLDQWREKELAKEREAIRQEEAANLLQGKAAPDMRRPTGAPGFDPTKLSDKDFDAWYVKHVLGRL